MNYPRETIYNSAYALLAATQLGGNPAFVTTSRKFRFWSDVPAADQPALFFQQRDQDAREVKNEGETLWDMYAYAWIYLMHDPSDDIIPATSINVMLDAVEKQMLPDPSGRQTLGGRVVHCYIDGRVQCDEGLVGSDPQSIILIPITIRTGV